MSPALRKNDRRGSPRIDATRSVGVSVSTPNDTRRITRRAATELFERELAYYRADAPFLPLEKCAERCELLSALLAAVTILEGHTEGPNAPAAD